MALDDLGEPRKIGRLAEVIREAGRLRARDVRGLRVTAQRDQRDGLEPRLRTHAGREREPIDVRQPEIEDRELGREGIELCETLRAVVHDDDLVAHRAEQLAEHVGSIDVVVDDEDPQARAHVQNFPRNVEHRHVARARAVTSAHAAVAITRRRAMPRTRGSRRQSRV